MTLSLLRAASSYSSTIAAATQDREADGGVPPIGVKIRSGPAVAGASTQRVFPVNLPPSAYCHRRDIGYVEPIMAAKFAQQVIAACRCASSLKSSEKHCCSPAHTSPASAPGSRPASVKWGIIRLIRKIFILSSPFAIAAAARPGNPAHIVTTKPMLNSRPARQGWSHVVQPGTAVHRDRLPGTRE